MRILWELLVSFCKIGCVAYGGGPSMVPLLKSEVVERRKWLTLEEFMDALAIGNALPGPIATKLASAIGYHTAGWTGLVIAVAAIILPGAAALLILLSFVAMVKDNPAVTSMLRGLRPVVVALLAYAAYDMAPAALKDYITWGIGIIALGLMIFTPIHPAVIVVLGAVAGVLLKL